MPPKCFGARPQVTALCLQAGSVRTGADRKVRRRLGPEDKKAPSEYIPKGLFCRAFYLANNKLSCHRRLVRRNGVGVDT